MDLKLSDTSLRQVISRKSNLP